MTTFNDSRVVSEIRRLWEEAKSHHDRVIKPRLLDNLYANRGVYPPQKQAELASFNLGLETVYIKMAANKQRTAAALIKDVYNRPGTRPWGLTLTPVPTVHPEIQKQIDDAILQKRAELAAQMVDPITGEQAVGMSYDEEQEFRKQAMEKVEEIMERDLKEVEDLIDDELTEGGFYTALDQVIDDITVFPVAYLKGPVLRKRACIAWKKQMVEQPDGTTKEDYVPATEEKIIKEYERVSPFDMYPGPNNETCHDGYIFQKHRMSDRELHAMLGMEQYGFRPDAIRQVLRTTYQSDVSLWSSSEQRDLEGKTFELVSGMHNVLEFYGSISGEDLYDWITDEVIDKDTYYNVEVWVASDVVIKVGINKDPLGRTPYDKASFQNVPGSFLGTSIYEMMSDHQDAANTAQRSLKLNIAFTSGPVAVLDPTKLDIEEDISVIRPFQVFRVSSRASQFAAVDGNRNLIEYYQAQSRISEMLAVIQNAQQQADEVTNIPRYMGGAPTGGGPADTATGFSMLMKYATTALKSVINNIDRQIIEPRLQAMYYYKMLYDPPSPIKRSDVAIVASGSMAVMAKEAMVARTNEFLNSPAVLQTLHPMELRAISLSQAENLGIDMDKFMRAAKELEVPQPPQGVAQQSQPDQRQLMDGTPIQNNIS